MHFNIIFDYPWWFLLLCLLAGAVSSAVLYYNNKAVDLLNWQKKTLAAFRFIVTCVLAFLLLAPLIKLNTIQPQEPVILVFQDNTQSILAGKNPELLREQYLVMADSLINELETDFDVRLYTFGEEVKREDSIDFSERITDMSQIFTSLDVLYSNRNVGAIIIASDGIYNRGRNPVFGNENLIFPVYTLAMGDTLSRKDIILNNLRHNKLTYLNNIFPVEITIEARQASGERSRLTITHNNESVFEQNIAIDSDHYFETITANLTAEEEGIQRYSVSLEPIDNEISIDNNFRDFFIEVIDSRQRVLIMAASPHPDVGAIRSSLEDNENYEVAVSLYQDFNDKLRDFDLVIWHQLPSLGNTAANLINQATQANMPQLFIIGNQTNINAFNRLQTGIQINVRAGGVSDSRAEPNSNFTLFQPSTDALTLLPLFPPIQSPFATYSLSPATQIFAYQRIGNVTTEYPLITLTQTSESKSGLIAGEGLWRWRLNNFARNNNHQAFNELISRIITFLSVVEDRSFFRISTENFLLENQPAIFDAELYNPSYELVNTPDVQMTITNEEGAVFEYLFSRTGNTYQLNAGIFPVGEYSYTASTRLGAESFSDEGIFTVSPLNIEGINTIANHQMLFQLANNTGGELFYPNQIDMLASHIKQRDDIRPVLYDQTRYEDLISLQWIFFLLLVLLSAEWFIRKYSGGY